MAKYHYYAEITYTIDKNHPDIGCIADWTNDKIFKYDDEYYLDSEFYTKSDAKEYIKRDLSIIAGGGYNSKHVHNKKFRIFEI